MEGLDYTNVSPASAKRAGAAFVVRYLGTSSKCLTASERDALHKLGIAIGVVFETTGKTWRGGKAAGQVDGSAARAAALRLGVPSDAIIYFAVDEDTANYAVINEYLAGAAETCAPFEARIYGGFGPVSNAPGDDHWQTYAWSAGRWSPKASLQQYLNGSSTDHDRTVGTGLSAVGGWLVPRVAVAPVKAPNPVVKPVAALRSRYVARGNMAHVAAAGVKYVKGYTASRAPIWKDRCASLVRNAYGLPSSAWGNVPTTAAAAFHAVPAKYIHSWYDAPVGVPVFWTGGSSGAGHVAIADGKGNVWTNDFGPNGYIGDGRVRLVPIAAISAHDKALVFKGWSEYYLGTRVYA